jgi:hypothetical protein
VFLLAAGRGPARTTCQNVLEHVRGWPHENRLLLTRAVLLRPGELPALRVTDGGVFDVVLSALRGDGEHDTNSDAAVALPRVLDSLQS